MGQTHGLPEDVCLDDFLNDLHALYPGIEEQIEDAYKACTANNTDEEGLMYEDVEPIMRHFLYQMGLGEMLPRVCNSEGKLRLSEITGMLQAAGTHLDTKQRLLCGDWKILIIAWVRRLQEEQAADLDRWHAHLNKMQLQQEQQFDAALRAFQATYIDQIEAYHKAVEADHKREEQYRSACVTFTLRREWEENQDIQDRFYESQQEYLAKMNNMAERNFAGRTIFSQQKEFISKVEEESKKINQIPFDGANRVFSFVYPANITSVGAPVSGGAMVPEKRRIKAGRH